MLRVTANSKGGKMTNTITLKYEGSLHCKVQWPDGDDLAINAPKAYGGCGDASPSPKDLFAAGYASCVAMTMDMAAKKNGFDIAGARVTVSPVWAEDKPLISEVNTVVQLSGAISEQQPEILRQGAHNCPIHNSLRQEIKTSFTFEIT
jgi:uncharacterized OsmC-like protein